MGMLKNADLRSTLLKILAPWIGFGDGKRRHGHLLPRLEHLVSGFKDVFICVNVELAVTDVSSHTHGQLKTPQGQDGLGAAAPKQLPRLFTDVINQLIPELRR